MKHGHCTGEKPSRTYISWKCMRARCLNPNHKSYDEYGGRGISIAERWNLFVNFLADMGERPKGMTLDRIDVEGDYGPGNCKWATASEQNYNKRKAYA